MKLAIKKGTSNEIYLIVWVCVSDGFSDGLVMVVMFDGGVS